MSFFKPQNPWVKYNAGASRSPEKLNPIGVLPQLGHNTVEWTVGVVSQYALDVINPAFDGAKSLLNIFNPRAYKDNGIFKNIPKSLLGFATREATAVKNILGWVVGWVGQSYQNVVQDNAMDISSATVDKVPLVWPAVWNIAKTMLSIPALAWKVPSFLVSNLLDKPADYLNTITARTWRHIPKTVLRV